MFIYTTEDNKLQGIQECGQWTNEHMAMLEDALKNAGREMIVTDKGIMACIDCGHVMGECDIKGVEEGQVVQVAGIHCHAPRRGNC